MDLRISYFKIFFEPLHFILWFLCKWFISEGIPGSTAREWEVGQDREESSCKLWAWLPLRATGIQSSTHLRSSTEEWESWSIYPPTSTWTPWSLCVGPPCSQAKKPAGIFTRLSAGVLWGRAEELWVEYQWHLLHYASPFSIAQYLGKYQRKWPMLLFSLPLKVSGHFSAPCIAFLPGLPVPM